MNNKDFLDYLETQMNYYKSFDRDMYIHYRNKLRVYKKVTDETVDTIIDKIDEVLVDYMFDYGKYEETNDEFFNDKEDMFVQVIKELNNRINNK